MGIFFKLAWRNMFRNKRRTLLASLAIGLGLAALIFTDAMVIGIEDNMIESATSTFLGDGQIHREGYQETQKVEQTINNLDTVVAELKDSPKVKAFTERMMAFGMVTSPSNVQSVSMVGIDPKNEEQLSKVDEAIVKGSYFTGSNSRNILIGTELADILDVGINDRIVVTLAEAHTGELKQEMFRVSGIFKFGVKEMDRGMGFIRLSKEQLMLGLPGQAHEIAIQFIAGEKIGQEKNAPFWKKFSKFGNVAEGWAELQPQLSSMLQYTQFSTYMMGAILFGVVIFGIINTLFMSLHERMFEFGVLRAVGTRPFEMGKLIVYEAACLSIISIVVGMILGYIITYIVSFSGINYNGIEFAGVTFRNVIYPVLRVRQFIEYPFWVFVFTTITGLYPAWYAARMQPADAMRKSF